MTIDEAPNYNPLTGGLCPFERWVVGEPPYKHVEKQIRALELTPLAKNFNNSNEVFSRTIAWASETQDRIHSANTFYLASCLAIIGANSWCAIKLLEIGVPVYGETIKLWTCIFIWAIWLGGSTLGLILTWCWTCEVEEYYLIQMYQSRLINDFEEKSTIRLFSNFKNSISLHPLQKSKVNRCMTDGFKIAFLCGILLFFVKLIGTVLKQDFPIGIETRQHGSIETVNTHYQIQLKDTKLNIEMVPIQ